MEEEDDEDFMASLEASMVHYKRVDAENKLIHAELKRRCDEANISCEEGFDEDAQEQYFKLSLSSGQGQEKRLLFVSADDVKSLLAIPFEKYTFLSGYSAIWSFQDGVIEAAIRPAGNFSLTPEEICDHLIRRLSGKDGTDFMLSNEDKSISIKFGLRSAAFKELIDSKAITITISGLKVSQPEQAINNLVKLSNAVFFEIDLSRRLQLILLGARPTSIRGKAGLGRNEPIDLQFPHNEYDYEPMMLYWIARSTEKMLHLKFLAFYQVIEFYFPKYLELKITDRILEIINKQGFDPKNSTDRKMLHDGVVDSLRKTNIDEKSQLRYILIKAFSEPQDLLNFINLDEKIKKALTDNENKRTKHKLEDKNVCRVVAERLYDIRCKVVHTKGDGRTPILLFTKEVEALNSYVKLIRYIAQVVLSANKNPLQF